jgi:hypothetical protein
MDNVILISGKAESGKTEFANAIQHHMSEVGRDVIRVSFGDFVKNTATKQFGWDGKKNSEGRKLLQYIGNDLGRKNNPVAWVCMAKELILALHTEFDYAVIDDFRYPNEAHVMSAIFDIIPVRIERPEHKSQLTEEQLMNESETALDHYICMWNIENSKGIRHLWNLAEQFVEKTILFS